MVKFIWRWVLTHLLKPLALYRSASHVNFNFGWFLTYNLILTASMVETLRIVLPGQFGAKWFEYLGWFIGLEFLMAEFEWFFHRYVLHRVTWKFFAALKEKHGEHHALTPVPKKAHGYPIEYAEQIESATFPAWALPAFWGVLGMVFVPMQLVWPNQPVMFCGLTAVTASFILYEVKHAIEHLPYEQYWKARVERSRSWKKYYCFHLIHHRFHLYNMAIGGFFGLPLDKLMGTYFVPTDKIPTDKLPTLDGVKIPMPPRVPRGFAALLDRLLTPRRK